MQKTVYLGMSADLVHRGHLNVIKTASQYGRVVVGLLTDKAIASYKRLPYLDYEHRREIIENIKGVDEVIPQHTLDYSENLLLVRPDYVVHGDDWKEGVQAVTRQKVIDLLAQWGGELIETPYVADISSTQLNTAISKIGTTPGIRLGKLRRLLQAKPIVRAIEAHNGLSGLIAENMEVKDAKGVKQQFDAVWISSLTTTASMGKPDIETVDITARLASMNDILEVTTKPIVFDGDSGGHPEHFWFTVRTLERYGVSAIIIEDKISGGGKRNSLHGLELKQAQEDPEIFAEKIRVGKRAAITSEFMVIARIESLILGKGHDDAMMRAAKYIEAQADGIMIHSAQKTPDEVLKFSREFRQKWPEVPLIAVPSSYNDIYEHELAEAGISLVIYANHLLRASYPAMQETAKRILTHQRSKECDDLCMPIKDVITLIPVP